MAGCANLNPECSGAAEQPRGLERVRGGRAGGRGGQGAADLPRGDHVPDVEP